MPTDNMEFPETHIERMDREEMSHRHRLELEKTANDRDVKISKNKLREARQDTWQIIGVGVLVAAVIISIVLAIGHYSGGGPDEGRREQQREQACLASGGGWVPKDLLVSGTDQGMCVHPGEKVKE